MNNEKIQIPTNIIRKYIVEEIRNRRNALMKAAYEHTIECVNECGIVYDEVSEEGWYASGIGTLSDDIDDGNLSIKEALELLTKSEKKIVYDKCKQWYKNNKEKER